MCTFETDAMNCRSGAPNPQQDGTPGCETSSPPEHPVDFVEIDKIFREYSKSFSEVLSGTGEIAP
jgi:hypothetical protein